MKILYLITKSNWGGAQRYVYDLATSFHAKGAETVVAFGGKGELEERLKQADVPTATLAKLGRDISLSKEIASAKEIYSLIRSEKPTILHLNSSKASGIGAVVGRLLGVPRIVVTVHGAPFREDRPYIARKMLYLFTWLTCLFAHKVITVSKQDEADIGAMFFIKKKIATVYLGLTYESARERTVPKGKEVRIVTVGEFTKNKGHIYGLQAAELLKQKGIPFSYTIIGEGEDRKKLEEYVAMKQLEDVVTLPGYQDARSILHNYDLYLLPSIKEGLPYILLEAGKASLPVVATITGGVPEIIRHEETGLLVHPKDVEGLASSLETMITNRKHAKVLGQNLHSHIVQNFSYSKMLVETAKVYGLIEGKAIAHARKLSTGDKK
jgi:glycosyltransferase involved in cell wall biosynthesis